MKRRQFIGSTLAGVVGASVASPLSVAAQTGDVRPTEAHWGFYRVDGGAKPDGAAKTDAVPTETAAVADTGRTAAPKKD